MYSHIQSLAVLVLNIPHTYDTNISKTVHSVSVHLHFIYPLEIGRMYSCFFLRCLRSRSSWWTDMSQNTTIPKTMVTKSKASLFLDFSEFLLTGLDLVFYLCCLYLSKFFKEIFNLILISFIFKDLYVFCCISFLERISISFMSFLFFLDSIYRVVSLSFSSL